MELTQSLLWRGIHSQGGGEGGQAPFETPPALGEVMPGEGKHRSQWFGSQECTNLQNHPGQARLPGVPGGCGGGGTKKGASHYPYLGSLSWDRLQDTLGGTRRGGGNHSPGLFQKQGSQSNRHSCSFHRKPSGGGEGRRGQASLQATGERPGCPLGQSSPASDIPEGLGRRERCWSVLGPGFRGRGMIFLEKGKRRCQEPNGTTSTKQAGQSPMMAGR